MIHPNKDTLTTLYDGREQIQIWGFRWNCQGSFFTLFGQPPMPSAPFGVRYDQLNDGWSRRLSLQTRN